MTNLSTATAQKTCEPTWLAVGTHVISIDHNDVLVTLWTSALLITIGKDKVAMSLIFRPLPQRLITVNVIVKFTPTCAPWQTSLLKSDIRSGFKVQFGTA